MERKWSVLSEVLLRWPNLLSYLRVLLLALCVLICEVDPIRGSGVYLLSLLMGAIDGRLIGMHNRKDHAHLESTLDMMIDRITTSLVYFRLTSLFPQQWRMYSILCMLDVCSHWSYTVSKRETGMATHKSAHSRLLYLYYSFPYLMLTLCIGQELYLAYHILEPELLSHSPQMHQLLYRSSTMPVKWILSCVFLMKQLINVMHLSEAIVILAQLDAHHSQ